MGPERDWKMKVDEMNEAVTNLESDPTDFCESTHMLNCGSGDTSTQHG